MTLDQSVVLQQVRRASSAAPGGQQQECEATRARIDEQLMEAPYAIDEVAIALATTMATRRRTAKNVSKLRLRRNRLLNPP